MSNKPMKVKPNLCRLATSMLYRTLTCVLLGACSSVPRIQTSRVPPGSLRLGQVMYLTKPEKMKDGKDFRDLLMASGLSATEITNGSFGLVRIYCCGGPNEKSTAPAIYIPSGIDVQLGDIVEFRAGHPPEKGVAGEVNTVTRVRQRLTDKEPTCRWDPPDERHWTRILYADWMPKEGWVLQHGLWKAWYKPPVGEKR